MSRLAWRWPAEPAFVPLGSWAPRVAGRSSHRTGGARRIAHYTHTPGRVPTAATLTREPSNNSRHRSRSEGGWRGPRGAHARHTRHRFPDTALRLTSPTRLFVSNANMRVRIKNPMPSAQLLPNDLVKRVAASAALPKD